MITRLFVAIAMMCVGALSQAEQELRWYLACQDIKSSVGSVAIGEESQTIQLHGGWSCWLTAVDSSSTRAFREVICDSEGKTVAFSVQCDSKNEKDRTQIRFKDESGKSLDFIEVGCERQEA